MPKYLYKAKDANGKTVTGSVKADNEFDAGNILKKNMLRGAELILENENRVASIFSSRVTTKDKAVFARQLATTIGAGVTLTKSMSILARQARTDKLKQIFFKVYQDLEEGHSFSNALSRYPDAFDRVFVSVVKSGESSGNLDVVLDQLANKLEDTQNFNAKLRGALYYPIFIVVALVAIGSYMLVSVVPRLEDLFLQSGVDLPFTTRILIGLSDFIVARWWIVVIVLIVSIVGLRYWSISAGGSRTIDRWKIELPLIKQLSIGIYMGTFARVMEMLVKSSVPILDSLRIAAKTVNNQIYEESISIVSQEVERGVPLSVPLEKDQNFPKLISQMVAVGEQSGKLDKVLDKVATYYEQETTEKIKSLSTLLEPIILVIVGLGVAFLIFAILMPIYNIAQLQ